MLIACMHSCSASKKRQHAVRGACTPGACTRTCTCTLMHWLARLATPLPDLLLLGAVRGVGASVVAGRSGACTPVWPGTASRSGQGGQQLEGRSRPYLPAGRGAATNQGRQTLLAAGAKIARQQQPTASHDGQMGQRGKQASPFIITTSHHHHHHALCACACTSSPRSLAGTAA